jgi:hypothetical protein
MKLFRVHSIWMRLDVHEVVQCEVHVPHDPHVQGQAHGEV